MGWSSWISASDRKGEQSREDLPFSQAVCCGLGTKCSEKGKDGLPSPGLWGAG